MSNENIAMVTIWTIWYSPLSNAYTLTEGRTRPIFNNDEPQEIDNELFCMFSASGYEAAKKHFDDVVGFHKEVKEKAETEPNDVQQ